MTKHAYKFYLPESSTVTLSQANQFINDWGEDNEAWVGDPTDTTIRERRVGEGTVYWTVTMRFHPMIDRTELQSKLNVRLQNNFNWFVVSYHVCEHDDRPIGNCSWDAIYYWPDTITIPDDIESLAPDPASVDEVIQVSTL